MKFDVKPDGRVLAELSMGEFVQVVGLLLSDSEDAQPAPARPEVCTYYVRGYAQVYVCEPGGGAYWVCSCNDFRYRRQSVAGDWCKHIPVAQMEHIQVSMARYRQAS